MTHHPRTATAIGAAAVVAAAIAVDTSTGPVSAAPSGGPVQVARIAQTPWEIALVPGSSTDAAFVTQKLGDIVYVPDLTGTHGTSPAVTVAMPRTAIPSVRDLLGLALAPDFASSGLAYVFVDRTDRDPDGSGPATGTSSIWRLRASGTTFRVVGQVLGDIPDDNEHDGGRLVFGPDGYLYASTGDFHDPTSAQSLGSLGGKILRLAVGATGVATAPADNPYVGRPGPAPYIWSLGHRNPQGLVFDAAGRLWEDEHGPSGDHYGPGYPGGDEKSGRDELNLIVRGGNYGWPLLSGPDSRPGYVSPVVVDGDSPAWAPGDLALGGDGSLYAAFMIGAAGPGGTAGPELHRFDLQDASVVGQGSQMTGLGRLRVAVASGSHLLVAADGDKFNSADQSGRIFRLPLAAPVPTSSGPPTPAPTSAPTSAATTPSARQVRHRAEQLGRRLAQALQGPGPRSATASVTAPAPAVGRVRLLLLRTHCHGSAGCRLAAATTRIAAEGSHRFRLRLGRTARARLASGRPTPAVLRIVVQPQMGEAVTVTRRLTLGPRAPAG